MKSRSIVFLVLILALALGATSVFAAPAPSGPVTVVWKGNGTTAGQCNTVTNLDPTVQEGQQRWLFILTQPYSSSGSTLTVQFDSPIIGTIDVRYTGGVYQFTVYTVQGATLLSASATNGSKNSVLTVSHCETNMPPLTVTKTASTSLTRTYGWTIDKSVTPDTLDLFVGETGTASYSVAVTKDAGTDSNWYAEGVITVHNNATITTAHVTGVSDAGVTLDCPAFPLDLAPGAEFTCSWSVAPSSGAAFTNTATATTTGLVGGGSGSVLVDFNTAVVTEVDPSITVSDSNGSGWTFDDSGVQTYSKDFTCDSTEGFTYKNTVMIQETLDGDSAAVTVNCYAPTISKSGSGSYNRDLSWDVTKSVDTSVFNLNMGDSATANYLVNVTKNVSEYGFAAGGTITITNPNPSEDFTASIDDPGVALVCGGSLLVPAGSSASCGWSSAPASATPFTNTASFSLFDQSYSASAEVAFTAIVTGDETVNIADTNAKGPQGIVGGSTSYPYSVPFSCGSSGNYPNTVTITGPHTNVSANADVTVWCYSPSVSKDGSGSFTHSVSWSIDKSVTPDSLVMIVGDPAQSANYTVLLTKSVSDSGSASGTIYVTNPNPDKEMNVSIADNLPVVLDCNGFLTVPAGQTATCGWSLTLSGSGSFDNTVTVTLNGYSTSATANIPVSYTASGDETVDLNDSIVGGLGSYGGGATVTYSNSFTCMTAGDSDHLNTATITGPNGTNLSDNASVHVHCSEPVKYWCSPGYWSNHLDIAAKYVDLSTPYSSIGGAPLKNGAPANPTIGDVLTQGPSVFGGPAFNSVANYISAAAFGPKAGTQSDHTVISGSDDYCPLDASGNYNSLWQG